MANMSVNQRNLYDRVELSVPTTGVTVKRRWLVASFTALGVGILAALTYAAVDGIREWSQVVVLGGIVLTVAGAMIALDPLRRR